VTFNSSYLDELRQKRDLIEKEFDKLLKGNSSANEFVDKINPVINKLIRENKWNQFIGSKYVQSLTNYSINLNTLLKNYIDSAQLGDDQDSNIKLNKLMVIANKIISEIASLIEEQSNSDILKSTQESAIREISFIGEKRIFVGRIDYLDNKLKNKLKEPGSRVSIVGSGGSGKSQLVFKALHQYYEKDKIIDLVVPVYLAPYSHFEKRIDGGTHVITNITFRNFLNDIGFYLIENKILPLSKQQFEDLDVNDCKSKINNLLSAKKHPILYCDNFETVSSALENEKNYLEIRNIFNFVNDELSRNTSVLLTSRIRKNFVTGEEVIDLRGLDIDEGIKLFIEYASAYRKNLENKNNTKLQDLLKQIVTRTGGHPLSLEILAKTYEGNGTSELEGILKTLGKERKDPFATEERLSSLNQSLKYSIHKLDFNSKKILPLLTIFHSPFLVEAVEQIFKTEEQIDLINLPSDLYNKSLLMRIEEDRYGQIDDRFWLYTFHPAIRNHLEDGYVNDISKLQDDVNFISNFCNYYKSLIEQTYNAWGTPNHTNFMRRFNLLTATEGKNDFDKAIEFEENFIVFDKEHENHGIKIGGSIASYLGLIYGNLGQYDKSLSNHIKSLEIHNVLNDRVSMALNYKNIGNVYSSKGQYDEAISYYKKSLEIYEDLNDRVGMARDYTNIGTVYSNKGRYDEALTYYKKSLEIFEGLNDIVNMAEIYKDMGLLYYNKGLYDNALIYYNKTLEICKNLNDIVKLVSIYVDIGHANLGKKNKDEAKVALDNALAIANEFKTDTGTIHPLKNLIDNLLESIE
jgi:tetratricopeptide (TPR) repeat protein